MNMIHVGPLATMIAAGALVLGAATPAMAAGDEVKAIYAGPFHACATKTDRTAWCWGDNQFHQIGDGTTDDRPTPVQVQKSGGGFLGGITRISAGSSSHTCAGKPDGTVLASALRALGYQREHYAHAQCVVRARRDQQRTSTKAGGGDGRRERAGG